MNDGESPAVEDRASLADIDANGPIAAVDRLLEQARAAAGVEVELAKAYAAAAVELGKRVSIWGMLTVLLAFVALLCLGVGLLIGLATVIGPWLATFAVVGSLLGATAATALRARHHVRLFKAASAGEVTP